MIKAQNNFVLCSSSGNISSQGCNAIQFANTGDVMAWLNGIWPLYPGQSVAINQVSPHVIDNTQYQVKFDTASSYTTGTNAQVAIIMTYIDQETLPIITSNNKTNGAAKCGIN